MDERRSRQEALEDIASSLRRIAAALEAGAFHSAAERDAPGRSDGASLLHRPPTKSPTPTKDPDGEGTAEEGGRTDAATTAAEEERRALLRQFLADRGITIKHERERGEADAVLDRVALFLGSRYPQVRKLCEHLKRHMNDGRAFTLNLRDEPQEAVSNICQLAHQLHTLAILEEYQYRRSPHYLLRARPSREPRAINFLNGGWLERYALATLLRAAHNIDPTARCAWLANPQVALPNGDDFELDVLFEVEGEVYWLELKTGEYQRHISKYAKIRRTLGLPPERTFLVLADIPSGSAAKLSSLFDMTVTTSGNLDAALTTAFASHLRPPSPLAAGEERLPRDERQ